MNSVSDSCVVDPEIGLILDADVEAGDPVEIALADLFEAEVQGYEADEDHDIDSGRELQAIREDLGRRGPEMPNGLASTDELRKRVLAHGQRP